MENIFQHVERGTVKFTLIGLSPYIVSENDKESLTVWDIKKNIPILEAYVQLCLDNGTKPVVVTLPVDWKLRRTYSQDVLKIFRQIINKLIKKYKYNQL